MACMRGMAQGGSDGHRGLDCVCMVTGYAARRGGGGNVMQPDRSGSEGPHRACMPVGVMMCCCSRADSSCGERPSCANVGAVGAEVRKAGAAAVGEPPAWTTYTVRGRGLTRSCALPLLNGCSSTARAWRAGAEAVIPFGSRAGRPQRALRSSMATPACEQIVAIAAVAATFARGWTAV
jgi:hypothetical protein